MGAAASNGQNTSYSNPYNSPRQAQYPRQQSTELAYPSVSQYTNNPERYPRFVLVTVLSTGKMQVMTRAETYGNRKVKIVSNPNGASSDDDSDFFAPSPPSRSAASSSQGYPGFVGGIRMEYVFALDLLSGLFVVVTKLDILMEPWRYRVLQNI